MKRPVPRTRTHRPRGFTLFEALTAVGIIGVLASLAVTGFLHGATRARASNATFEINALFSVGQLRAASTGRPQYLVLWQSSTSAYGVQLLDFVGPGALPAWSSMTPGTPSAGFTLVDEVKLATGSEARVALPTLTSAKARITALASLTALPAPYQTVPLTAAGGSSALGQACSFCAAQGAGALGVLRFNTDGTLEVLTGTATTGGSFAMDLSNSNNQYDPRIVAFTAPLATVKVFR